MDVDARKTAHILLMDDKGPSPVGPNVFIYLLGLMASNPFLFIIIKNVRSFGRKIILAFRL